EGDSKVAHVCSSGPGRGLAATLVTEPASQKKTYANRVEFSTTAVNALRAIPTAVTPTSSPALRCSGVAALHQARTPAAHSPPSTTTWRRSPRTPSSTAYFRY